METDELKHIEPIENAKVSSPLQEVVREQNPSKYEKSYITKNGPVPMVTFHDGGEGKSLPYIDLQEIQWRAAVPNTLTCIFSGWDIILKGHRLSTVWEDLSAHQVVRLDADPRAADLKEHEHTCYIASMQFIARTAEEGLDTLADTDAGADT